MAEKKARSTMEFRIRNVNGITDERITIERGKVTELRGRNGAGKTSAMRALARYMGDDRAKVEVKDGADVGSVEGPGATLQVTEKARLRGTPSIYAADRSGALVRLIGGAGRKGDVERAREYIRALAELVDVPASEASLATICYNDAGLIDWLSRQVDHGGIRDLFTATLLLKPEIDERARTAENEALACDGRIDAAGENIDRAREGLAALAVDAVPDGEVVNQVAAQQRVADAGADAARVKERRQAMLDRQALQGRIRASLGEDPKTTTAYKAVVARLEDAEREREEADALVERLQRELAAAETRQQLALSAAGSAAYALAQADDRAAEWRSQSAILGETVEGPSEGDVLNAEMALEHAKVEQERHHATHDLRLALASRQQARQEKGAAEFEGKRLRSIAHTLADRLGEILSQRGLANITVVDGRLAWRDPESGKILDWDTRMSSGQRVRAAFELAAGQFNGVVFLPANEDNAFYMLLDPEHRAELEQIVHDMDLFVVTEVPADGPLTVVQAGKE